MAVTDETIPIPDLIHPRHLTLQEASPLIADGDLLLWRRVGLISRCGRGIHSHAAMAAWFRDQLWVLEIRELKGGRGVPLASQVQKYPGRIDVFRADAGYRWNFDRRGAVDAMQDLAGKPYGYLGVAAAALLHMPLVRLAVAADVDDQAASQRPPFCSHAVALASRIGGGVDVVANLADALVEPADLARSLFYEHLCTLTGVR